MHKKEPPIILAIVGARTFNNQTLFNETMQEFVVQHGLPTRVVSGGARGADTMGERWARRHQIAVTILRPRWKTKDGTFDKAAGIKRNTDIVRECTHMVAFPSKTGRGTQDSVRKAKKEGKVVTVIHFD